MEWLNRMVDFNLQDCPHDLADQIYTNNYSFSLEHHYLKNHQNAYAISLLESQENSILFFT